MCGRKRLMIRLMFMLIFFTMHGWVNAQNKTSNFSISRIMGNIPDSLTYTTSDIAGYISSSFSYQADKSNAAFYWVTNNIRYIFDSIITNSLTESPSAISERALKTRTGVCLNFAHLFNEISNKAGIKTFIIQGYTRQYGKVDILPHMWCASYIDSAWFLFDPSWDAGYYSRGQFVNSNGKNYCMKKPAEMIRNHMPFDPLWQFLPYPWTYDDFSRGKSRKNTNRAFFDVADSIARWERASTLERAGMSARRIENNGTRNNLVNAKLSVIRGEITDFQNRLAVQRYDTAVIIYNTGITHLNSYIGLRNKMPPDDTAQMKSHLQQSEICLRSALGIVDNLSFPEEQNMAAIKRLRNEISNTMMKVNLQKADFFRTFVQD